MVHRRWREVRQTKHKTAFAALGNLALQMVDVVEEVAKRIENMIRYDMNEADLARLRNEGWQVVHYQFVNNDRDLPTLAVVMERVVDVEPTPEDALTPSPSPSGRGEQKPETAPSEPEIVIVPDANPVLEKLAEKMPIFAAVCAKGVDAVIDEMNAEVVEKAYEAFKSADVDIQTTRFESRLLTDKALTPSPSPSGRGELKEDLVIEVM